MICNLPDCSKELGSLQSKGSRGYIQPHKMKGTQVRGPDYFYFRAEWKSLSVQTSGTNTPAVRHFTGTEDCGSSEGRQGRVVGGKR